MGVGVGEDSTGVVGDREESVDGLTSDLGALGIYQIVDFYSSQITQLVISVTVAIRVRNPFT